MNKAATILFAILGGIEVVFYILTPLMLVTLWMSLTGVVDWLDYVFMGSGLFATLFRAIKIGWLRK